MPGWKQQIGREIDEIISATLPEVKKAVRWNTPFYGVAGQGWFLGFHCMKTYVKIAFLRGASLDPLPPISSKQPEVRYWHVSENSCIDREQLRAWILQAVETPGDPLF